MPAVAAIIHDSVGIREPDVVHVAAFAAEMHSLNVASVVGLCYYKMMQHCLIQFLN